ncbi:MAG: WbqC family protein [Candidatus Methanofastidiosa archaeon]|nr:WbqC family protein [Candidatus Methanofastidiosa archaeon]
MTNHSIVISQPYYFPWPGLFEQMRLASIFIHYDDVQFSKGHFQDRVQIKTEKGIKWLTVPKKNLKLGQNICEVAIDNTKDWKRIQLEFLRQVFKNAPYVKDMLNLVVNVFDNEFKYLSELTILSTMAVGDYLNLKKDTLYYKSSDLPVKGTGTERVLNIVKYFNAACYLTGMGALKYLDFELFEKHNIKVRFIEYKKKEYRQLFGFFNPYVSSLDLIANEGKDSFQYICSESVYWKEFINSVEAKKYLAGESS